tara:strand:+ start:2753 stop:3349 length:597 start_codon:yes stop_codon:yes gene_type:complete
MLKKFYILISILLSLFYLNACGPFKYKPVDANEFPPEPSKRVKKNIEEGRGFRFENFGGSGATTYEFASSNPLWRASLDILDFMPLTTANYSGGIIVTDWYSEDNSKTESVKISIRFLSNEVRSDALDINVFVKKCDPNNNCITSNDDGDLLTSLETSILKKAALYEKADFAKNKKKRRYKGSAVSGADREKSEKKSD